MYTMYLALFLAIGEWLAPPAPCGGAEMRKQYIRRGGVLHSWLSWTVWLGVQRVVLRLQHADQMWVSEWECYHDGWWECGHFGPPGQKSYLPHDSSPCMRAY